MNSKPPTIHFGIAASTFSDNLSRNSCKSIQEVISWSWIFRQSLNPAFLDDFVLFCLVHAASSKEVLFPFYVYTAYNSSHQEIRTSRLVTLRMQFTILSRSNLGSFSRQKKLNIYIDTHTRSNQWLWSASMDVLTWLQAPSYLNKQRNKQKYAKLRTKR